jgi:hypothetical protein
MEEKRKKARIHIYMLRTFLKILIGSIIGLFFISIINDIFILPSFTMAFSVLSVIGIIVGGVGALCIIFEIFGAFDYDFRIDYDYRDEIYNQLFKNKHDRY